MTSPRQKRQDDELAYALLMICWKIKARVLGDTGDLHREPQR